MGNRARIPVARLGTAALRRVALPAAGLWKKSGGVLPPDPGEAIMQACVLWYDISKQQATNEGMAANPVLRDLSGNGHDATCYNFAWSGMSGIGGYEMDSSDWTVYSSATYTRPTPTTIHITKVSPSNNDLLIAWITENGSADVVAGSEFTLPAIRFKVQGIADGELRAYTRNADGYSQYLANGQEYYFPGGTFVSKGSNNGFEIGWVNIDKTERDVDITVELLPLYPNALVSDGVDDYAQVTGLPILTKERGYTVVVKREILKLNTNSCIAQKRKGNNQSFSFERNREDILICTNWGHINNIDISAGLEITYQTSKSYNGTKKLNAGDYKDADTLVLFTELNCCKCVLYSFLLFDRDLTEDEIEWVKENMVEYKEVTEDWYGVEFYTTSPYPDCIRIGNMDLHRSLPVQSAMKGCLLNDDGEVVKYLDENDWTSETRDGSQGQVMVEIPDHYVKFETEGNIRRVKMSMSPLDGFKKVARHYIGAYEAALQRSTSKLASVATADPDYRGGSNVPNRDEKFNTLLGRPVSSIGFTDARNYARNRNGSATAEWNCITYDAWKTLYWLFVVEYATLDSQKPLVEGKGQDGFMQGGLGNGVTNINATKWQAYYQSVFIPCGFTDGLGNRTGQMPFTMAFEYDANGSLYYNGEYDPGTAYTDGQFVSQGEDLYECVANAPAGTALSDTAYFKKVARTITYVNRYRGIEMPFGHLFKMVDGIVFIYTAIDNNTVKGEALACSDPAKFSFESYDGYALLGDVGVYGKSYIKEVMFGENGDIVIKAGGGSYDSYFCDGIRTQGSFSPGYPYIGTMVFGGCASYGLTAGLLYEDSYTNPRTYGNSQTGTRLCFIPEQKNKSI